MLPDRVTLDYIESRIRSVAYDRPIGTLTVCYVELDNGFVAVGTSACVDPATFKRETGEEIAYENAIEALWPLFGFALVEQRYRAAD